jgi:hypothetical protein
MWCRVCDGSNGSVATWNIEVPTLVNEHSTSAHRYRPYAVLLPIRLVPLLDFRLALTVIESSNLLGGIVPKDVESSRCAGSVAGRVRRVPCPRLSSARHRTIRWGIRKPSGLLSIPFLLAKKF